jgi:hypothetical protein
MKNDIVNKIKELESEISAKQKLLQQLKKHKKVKELEHVCSNKYFVKCNKGVSVMVYIKHLIEIKDECIFAQGLEFSKDNQIDRMVYTLRDGKVMICMTDCKEISKEEFLSQFENCCKLIKESVNKYINEP